ncbi:MAG: membrane protein insertase YidC [Candidatus Theseobacter exili]|nr:membrane protein insertase YidC [Candidatus Theseobacter exili]
MEKRALIALVLSFAVLYIYMTYQKAQSPKRPVVVHQAEQPADTTVTSKAQEIPSIARVSSLPDEDINLEEKTVSISSPYAEISLSNVGAGIKSCILLEKGVIRGKPAKLISDGDGIIPPLVIDRIGEITQGALRKFNITESSETMVVFERVFDKQLLVKKRFSIDPDTYMLRLDLDISNLKDDPIRIFKGIDISCGVLVPAVKKGGERNLRANVCQDDSALTFQQEKIYKLRSRKVETAPIKWAGSSNVFFTVILQPKKAMNAVIMDVKNSLGESGNKKKVYYLGLRSDDFIIAGKDTRRFSFTYYFGPKDYEILKASGQKYEDVMNLKGPFGTITRYLLILLKWMYGIVKNYGIAIILVTILIKIVFWPLTQKSFKSMKQMQLLQPELAELKKQYKDNPKKLQQETMALYKKNKVNPLGGCIPMVLQIPIFFALFTMLRSSIELRGANFLWIKDLTMPDQCFAIPGMPVDINILPLIMGATMFWQQKMSTVDANQQKMMAFMPLIFTVMFYGLPSGLVLYWLTNNILTIAQQYMIKRSP